MCAARSGPEGGEGFSWEVLGALSLPSGLGGSGVPAALTALRRGIESKTARLAQQSCRIAPLSPFSPPLRRSVTLISCRVPYLVCQKLVVPRLIFL